MPDTPNVRTKPLVLVVDDDEDLRTLARIHLGKAFDVVEADDGLACIEAATTHGPDVILLDMMMPGMSGSEVLDALSAEANTRDIPVIFLSAKTESDDRVKALEEGALDYVTKPADWRELSARVGAAARVHARHQELLAGTTSDPATGLPGRSVFEDRLLEEVSRSERSGSPLALLLIAVDDYENYALRFTESAAADHVAAIAEVLRVSLRASDRLFRYARDQFAAILPDTDVATAYLAAERLRDAVRPRQADVEVPSLSIGVADRLAGHTAADLMAKAEVALFRARESGGNLSWRSDDRRKHAMNPVALAEELTDREWEVLTQLAQKRTEIDIGRRLGISSGTVRSHKARIRRKLHVKPETKLADFVKTNFGIVADRMAQTAIRRAEEE